MILSEQTHYTARAFGIETAIGMIADAGFDAMDLSMFIEPSTDWMFSDGYAARAEKIGALARSRGVYFNQAHAPFPTVKPNDPEYSRENLRRVRRSIEIAGILGIKNIIVHPVVFPENLKENNLQMYLDLLPDAKAAGVKIALENMWGRDDRRGVICKNVCSDAATLAEYADALPKEYFTVCLDIGHVGLVGEYEAQTIRALGAERLTCVHIHDNDYIHDSHRAPFTMRLPWKEIARAFADIGYRGDLTLEADDFLGPLPKALYASGLRFMHDAGRYLIRMIEDGADY